jgi:hypothetical protein
MKLKDILQRVNKSEAFKDKIYIGDIAERVFDLPYIQNWDDQDRLVSYYLRNWLCTDAYVGYKVYFLDNKPVAVSSQSGRKSVEHFQWVSEEDYKAVIDYVMTFADKLDNLIDIVDLEQEIPDTYKIEYYGQLLSHHKSNAIYNDKKVKVLNYRSAYNANGKYNPEMVQIEDENNTTEWVETKSLLFPLNIL